MILLQIFGEIENPYRGAYEAFPGGSPVGFGNFINNILRGVLVTSGLLLFLFLVYGGFRYLTAAGDEKAIDQAKEILSGAVIGLGIVAGSWFAVKIAETILGISILSPIFTGP